MRALTIIVDLFRTLVVNLYVRYRELKVILNEPEYGRVDRNREW